MVVGFASSIVIGPWVWWRQPRSNLLSQLVTYKVASGYTSQIVMSVSYERSILFTFIAISCMRTSVQRKKKHELSSNRSARRTKSLVDIVCGCLPIYQICASYHTDVHTSRRCAPSITTCMLLTRPYTTSSVWAAVILDSSRVSRSRC